MTEIGVGEVVIASGLRAEVLGEERRDIYG